MKQNYLVKPQKYLTILMLGMDMELKGKKYMRLRYNKTKNL